MVGQFVVIFFVFLFNLDIFPLYLLFKNMQCIRTSCSVIFTLDETTIRSLMVNQKRRRVVFKMLDDKIMTLSEHSPPPLPLFTIYCLADHFSQLSLYLHFSQNKQVILGYSHESCPAVLAPLGDELGDAEAILPQLARSNK